MSIEEAFRIAIQQHQAGQLPQAQQLYRQILAHQPRHPGALHFLGVIAYQTGKSKIAIDLISQAVALQPTNPEAHNNLGSALEQQGQLNEAIAAYRQAVAIRPDYAEAHNNLSNSLREIGQTEDAITAARQAIALRPNYAEAFTNLGVALADKGQLDEAIAAYRQAIQFKPNLPQAYNNLGSALQKQGQLDQAVVAYHQALALKPDLAPAHNNLGNALREKGDLDQAIAAYRSAILLDPNYAQAFSNLGIALTDKPDLEEALAACRRAIALDPNYAEAYNNLGNVLRDSGQPDDAVAAYQKAISLKPELAKAHNNLGNALKDQGQLDQAVAAYRQAVALDPNYHDAHSNLVYLLHFHPKCDASAIAEELHRWNHQHAEPLASSIQPHTNSADPHRRLKIGYVSPDFRMQAESHFVVPLMEAHEHKQFEIHCYASVITPDHITDRIRANSDVWHNVLGHSDAQLAHQIRQDGIDILVDLTMHMSRNRLLLFARKPAPVQFTWLAYPGSTGLRTIDYRITDTHMDPPGVFDHIYSEESVRLPDSWCCYDPLIQLENQSNRESVPLRFGSLNNPCKLNEDVLKSWTRILTAVADSKLIVLVESHQQRAKIGHLFDQASIPAQRLHFVSRLSRIAYLKLYDQIDIALDVLPYNGITTTCDALWMGVPVISLCGRTASGRAGLSILRTIGLTELVATSPDLYVDLAVNLANDLPRLSDMRSMLRRRMEQSPLMNAPRFALNIETAYRQAWQKWCASH